MTKWSKLAFGKIKNQRKENKKNVTGEKEGITEINDKIKGNENIAPSQSMN
ncbi:hypothetical protein [uncultured Pantoea sp.]|uniref:hypothetical protein n=1 Tax=uncultured Pantoea sp. TaxID=218084 RepID=UPI0025DD517B|nr:hypothetical protein [uncultured Pantoea sp.]